VTLAAAIDSYLRARAGAAGGGNGEAPVVGLWQRTARTEARRE
jgi:hypothetical protein